MTLGGHARKRAYARYAESACAVSPKAQRRIAGANAIVVPPNRHRRIHDGLANDHRPTTQTASGATNHIQEVYRTYPIMAVGIAKSPTTTIAVTHRSGIRPNASATATSARNIHRVRGRMGVTLA